MSDSVYYWQLALGIAFGVTTAYLLLVNSCLRLKLRYLQDYLDVCEQILDSSLKSSPGLDTSRLDALRNSEIRTRNFNRVDDNALG